MWLPTLLPCRYCIPPECPHCHFQTQSFPNSFTLLQAILTELIHLPKYIITFVITNFSVSYLFRSLMMPFSSPFSQSQPQSEIPQENSNPTRQFEYSSLLLSGTSDPPSALGIAFPSEVFFPNDDYPPGFPCTSGCGKKFPTVIMQEIHVQHYCKGPYDEIESCLETSVAAFDTPSMNPDDDHNGMHQLPLSPGMGQMETNTALIPAVSISSGSDCGVTPQLPSLPGTGELETDPTLIPAVSIYSGGEHGVTPQLPLSPDTSQLETDHSSVPAGDNSKGVYCPACNMYLTTRQNLKVHMEIHDWPTIPCPVDVCHYSARSQDGLDLHMRVRHPAVTDEREGDPFSCCHCGRIMGNPERLRRHLRWHDAGKFPCPIEPCLARAMSTQVALDQHLDSKHGNIPDV